jgi:hypothetical protein
MNHLVAVFRVRMRNKTKRILLLIDDFKLQSGTSAVEGISQMAKDAEQQHQDLLALLAAYPELTNSDLASVRITLSFRFQVR